MFLLILYLAVALGISFICSVLEAVLLSTTASFVSLKESEGAKGVELLKQQKQNIDRPISAILSLNTVAHTVGAAGVGSQAVKVFGEAYFGVISAVLTVLILVFSEIIPKTIGANYWRALAIPSAKVIRVMVFITYPLVWVSEQITHLIAKDSGDETISREEVSAMVNVGAEAGVFHLKENKMIQNLIKMDSVTARTVMTPSVVVAAAKVDTSLGEFYKDSRFNPYSRILVYKDNKDYISGYILRKTVLERLTEDKFDITLGEIERPVLSFLESTSLMQIWEQMIEKKEHISIIIDEYGCMRGVVTMEDIIETMLGFEIVDENDFVEDMQDLARQRWQAIKDREEQTQK